MLDKDSVGPILTKPSTTQNWSLNNWMKVQQITQIEYQELGLPMAGKTIYNFTYL